MARLNEAPAPPESIDIVKRRFMRQNRDLARSNSTQSVRIRNLELENGHLLSENLALREETLALQIEVEKLKQLPSPESINKAKQELEAKLFELGTIIRRLNIPEMTSIRPVPTALKKSPEDRVWRNPLLNGDELSAQLPTIREDKQYPRQTLEPIEVTRMIIDSVPESPDIGPPPVSHLSGNDMDSCSTEHDAHKASAISPRKGSRENSSAPMLSANLETRRRRRDSQTKVDNARHLAPEDPTMEEPANKSQDRVKEGAPPSRTGTKRKLSVREDDESSTKADSEFSFSRRGAPRLSISRARSSSSQQQSGGVADRKILSNKSTNMSPKKASRVLSTEKPKADSLVQKPPSKSKSTEVTRPTFSVPPPPDPAQLGSTLSKPEMLNMPPETPATLNDLLSPFSLYASTGRPQTKDTPPPGDLGDDSNNGRPSRRSRPRVNYAEPDLISKMRRPTKELVDAVTGEGKKLTNATGSDNPGGASALAENPNMRSAVIKGERHGDQSVHWSQSKAEPMSPLGLKTGLSNADSEPTAEEMSGKEGTSSGSSAVISALISGSKKKAPVSVQKPPKDTSGHGPDPMAIFEFVSSSPDNKTSSLFNETDNAALPKTRVSRRHSSISSLNPDVDTGRSRTATKDTAIDRTRMASSGAAGRRKTVLAKDLPDLAVEPLHDDRAQRRDAVARRRRSMML